MKYNLIMDTDSYKASHWLQYPPQTTAMYSYLESDRIPRSQNNHCSPRSRLHGIPMTSIPLIHIANYYN
jgi:Nicotinamide phosphoribosyltransferase, N-terminal domain